jgi:hypothetical protein
MDLYKQEIEDLEDREEDKEGEQVISKFPI